MRKLLERLSLTQDHTVKEQGLEPWIYLVQYFLRATMYRGIILVFLCQTTKGDDLEFQARLCF